MPVPPSTELEPPRLLLDQRRTLQTYVEAAAFCELAFVRQDMERLAVLSYMNRFHIRATVCPGPYVSAMLTRPNAP
jgi:hypothetical protein